MKNLNRLIPFQEILDSEFTKEEQQLLDLRVQLKITLHKLKETRKKLRLTQQELAKRAGLPRTTISKIESGYQNVSIIKVQQLAAALNKDVEIVLTDRKAKK